MITHEDFMDFTELSKTIKADREKEAKKAFIDEVINLLARGIKLYDLPASYAYDIGIYLINKSGLSTWNISPTP